MTEGRNNLIHFREELIRLEMRLFECNHQNEDGESLLESVNDNGGVKCKDCGLEYSEKPISANELEKALKIYTAALNQIKTFIDDDEVEDILRVGNIHDILPSMKDMYHQHIEEEFKPVRIKDRRIKYRRPIGYSNVKSNTLDVTRRKKKDTE